MSKTCGTLTQTRSQSPCPINEDVRRDFPHSDEGGGNWQTQIGPQIGGAAQGSASGARFVSPTTTGDHFVSPPLETPRVRRVNVNFSDQAYETLEELARRSGKSMSDVLREAIALKAWFDRERAEGGRILVERPNGQVREIISV